MIGSLPALVSNSLSVEYLCGAFRKRGVSQALQTYSMINAEKSYYKLKQTKNVGLDGRHFLLNLMTTYNFASETGDNILYHLQHRKTTTA